MRNRNAESEVGTAPGVLLSTRTTPVGFIGTDGQIRRLQEVVAPSVTAFAVEPAAPAFGVPIDEQRRAPAPEAMHRPGTDGPRPLSSTV